MSRAVTLHAVGDVWLNEGFAGRPSVPEVRRAFELFADASVVVANLEGPLSTGGYPTEKLFNLRADPRRVEDLSGLAIDVVSLANNHMMDYGPEALLETLEVLERAGVRHAGAGRNLEEAWQPVHLDVEGVRVAFLSFASTLVPGAAAEEAQPGLAPVRAFTAFVMEPNPLMLEQPGPPPPVRTWPLEADMIELERRVRSAKADADFLVLAAHWGVGGQEQPCDYQRILAHLAIDAGADLIAGHHPHILQPVECYRGKVCFYSLGNFIFQSLPSQSRPPLTYGDRMQPGTVYNRMSRQTMMVRARLGKEGNLETELVPFVLDEEGHPRVAAGADADSILRHVARLSAPFGARLAIGEGRARVYPA